MLKTAMILAAGRGQRMGSLAEQTHKALLKINERYLISYQLEKLAAIGVEKVVLNLHHFVEQVQTALGHEQYGLQIDYSIEPELLGTGGGIYHALPLLGSEPFILLSADVWSDYPLGNLHALPIELAHLVLTDNPSYHLQGDFALEGQKIVLEGEPKFTYASIAVLHPKIFNKPKNPMFPLLEVLKPAITADKVTGEYYAGKIFNANTPDELQTLTEFVQHAEET